MAAATETTAAAPRPRAIIITTTFDERKGRTHLVAHSLCPSQDVRDAVLASMA
jgi:hypothetical protein